MTSLRPGHPQNPHYAIFALNLANNENLPMILNAGSTAQARRRCHRSAPSTAAPILPISITSTTTLANHPPSTVSDGYNSSDDSLHLPSSARQRRARANAPFLPLLPGCSAPVASAGPHDEAAAAAASTASSRQSRRNSASSVSSSAFSWQESIFHVRRLSDGRDDQMRAPNQSGLRVERGRDGRPLVPPPRRGSRPHPNPLRSNPVFEGGWL